MVNRISAAIGMIAVIGGLNASAIAGTPSESAVRDRKAEIEGVVRAEMAARDIPGLQLAIVQNGKIVFTGAYGKANLEASAPVTNQTVFAINSISKAVAGVAAMQLVQAGRLDLDATLPTYLKGLPEAWHAITVRQLLTHMSGLPEIADDNVRLIEGAAPAAAWAKVQTLPLRNTPGARFDYTQTNYVALGKIIEAITGKPYSDFVRDRQFKAVGMKRAGFIDPANPAPNAALLYTHLTLKIDGMKTVGVERSKTPFARPEPWMELLRPAGGIQASATDLANWTIALQKLKLVDKAGLAELWKPQPQQDGTYRAFNSTVNGYGLGWPSARRAAHPAVTPVGGARAAIFIYPNDDLTVVVLTNLMGASPEKFVDKIASSYIPDLAAAK